MSAIDETQIKSDGLGHLLQDSVFVVPPYQRSYSWQTSNVDQFMIDVINSFNTGAAEYFLGTIVLIKNDSDYGIVDGQQRLATTSLLLAAIKTYLKKNGEDERAKSLERFLVDVDVDLEATYRMTLNGTDNAFFSELINNTDYKITKSDPKSAQNMANALKIIDSHIAAFIKSSSDPVNHLASLVKYIREKLKVIKIVVTDESNAFTIFETLNDRGLDLSVADLLKNYLFSHAGKTHIEEAKIQWATIQATLGTVGDEAMLPTFIRHYWISKYESVTNNDLFKKIKLKIHNKDEALALLKDLADASKDYASLQNAQHERWRSLGMATEINIQHLNSFRFEQTKPLLLSILRNFSDAQLPKTLEKMVHWSVRIQVAGDTRTGQLSVKLKAVIDAINAQGSQVRTSKTLGRKLLSESLVPNNKVFTEAFSQITPRIALARYYLIKLENMKRQEEGGKGEMVPDDSPNEVSLEHILPLTISDQADWPAFTAEQASEYHGRLGNMTILQAKDNSKIGNLSFANKKPFLAASEITITSDLGNAPTWDPTAIEMRQQELSRLAVKAWPV